MEIIPFSDQYAYEAALIHIEGQPGTLLTRLGPKFLTRMYRAIAGSPQSFGFVAVDGDTVAGVTIMAQDTGQMFADIKRRYWHQLAWPVAAQILRHPSLVWEIVQSLRYPNAVAAPPNEAEVLFLGLRREYMRQGLALRMIHLFLDEAHRRGCPTASTTIDKKNRAIRWTMGHLPGAYIDHEIQLHGRTMLVYRAKLPVRYADTREDANDAEQNPQN